MSVRRAIGSGHAECGDGCASDAVGAWPGGQGKWSSDYRALVQASCGSGTFSEERRRPGEVVPWTTDS